MEQHVFYFSCASLLFSRAPLLFSCASHRYPLTDPTWFVKLKERMKTAFLARPAQEWETIFGAMKIPGAKTRTTKEWLNSEHALASGLVRERRWAPTDGKKKQHDTHTHPTYTVHSFLMSITHTHTHTGQYTTCNMQCTIHALPPASLSLSHTHTHAQVERRVRWCGRRGLWCGRRGRWCLHRKHHGWRDAPPPCRLFTAGHRKRSRQRRQRWQGGLAAAPTTALVTVGSGCRGPVWWTCVM